MNSSFTKAKFIYITEVLPRLGSYGGDRYTSGVGKEQDSTDWGRTSLHEVAMGVYETHNPLSNPLY